MNSRENTKRMHSDIKKDFGNMCKVIEHGVQKFSTEYILNNLANKYYKSPKTIENIVFGRTQIKSQPP